MKLFLNSNIASAVRGTSVLLLFAATAFLTTMIGCGDGHPKRVPVSGQVLIDEKPVPCGIIRFVPENGRPAIATIQPDGKFALKTFGDKDGAILGTHAVVVIASEELSPTKQKWHAPKQYANLKTSDLTATIDKPTDSLTIKLTWDGGKTFIETIEK